MQWTLRERHYWQHWIDEKDRSEDWLEKASFLQLETLFWTYFHRKKEDLCKFVPVLEFLTQQWPGWFERLRDSVIQNLRNVEDWIQGISTRKGEPMRPMVTHWADLFFWCCEDDAGHRRELVRLLHQSGLAAEVSSFHEALAWCQQAMFLAA